MDDSPFYGEALSVLYLAKTILLQVFYHFDSRINFRVSFNNTIGSFVKTASRYIKSHNKSFSYSTEQISHLIHSNWCPLECFLVKCIMSVSFRKQGGDKV